MLLRDDYKKRYKKYKERKSIEINYKTNIKHYSDYLIIHVKRLNKELGTVKKNNNQVQINEIITFGLSKYCVRSIVVHSGGATGGHYIAYVKRGNKWRLISDSTVADYDDDDPLNPLNDENVQQNFTTLMYEKL